MNAEHFLQARIPVVKSTILRPRIAPDQTLTETLKRCPRANPVHGDVRARLSSMGTSSGEKERTRKAYCITKVAPGLCGVQIRASA